MKPQKRQLSRPICVSPSAGGHTLRLALLLAFPVIAIEQIIHTDISTLTALPLYQTLHWLSDGLLVLPLAAIAVWGGQRLAAQLGLDATPSAIVGRACLIALLFAFVLVPGAALHDWADRLTHVHARVATHSHVPRPTPSRIGEAATLARAAGHALTDGLTGQAVGLPLTILAFVWRDRKQRPRSVVALKTVALKAVALETKEA